MDDYRFVSTFRFSANDGVTRADDVTDKPANEFVEPHILRVVVENVGPAVGRVPCKHGHRSSPNRYTTKLLRFHVRELDSNVAVLDRLTNYTQPNCII